MSDCRVMVFLRAPRLGAVKTRLASTLGAEAALAVYRELVAATLRAVSPLRNVELHVTPDDAVAEVAVMAIPGWNVVSQGDGDLGTRLQRAFARGFSGGAERLVVIGADCPRLDARDIHDAWSALGHSDLVLGPASDGGYWLIALRSPQPSLFEGIHWGGTDVLRQTLDRAGDAGLRVHCLRELGDVDTAEDWARESRPGGGAIPAGAELTRPRDDPRRL